MSFDNKKEFVLIALIVLLGVIVLFNPLKTIVGETPLPEKTLSEGKNLQESVEFNVDEYSSKLSSKKAESAILEFAEETADEKNAVELTVYNQNLGLVKETRELDLKKGFNLVTYEDIAKTIKPETVLFKDLDFADTFVVEQNYEYDLASEETLLEKYLGKELKVEMKEGKTFEGKLLSYTGNLLLETSNGIASVNKAEIQNIEFPSKEELMLKPSLIWTMHANNEGKRNTETTYLASGLNWNADYVAEVNEDSTAMNLKGWVTLENNSGTSYPNAGLKLIAGEVHTNQPSYGYETKGAMYKTAVMPETAGGGAFEEEKMFEYHMYSLKGNTTLKDKAQKQISLLTAENVKVEKEYVYDDYKAAKKVQVKINFKNDEASGLGMPLPAGNVRVYNKDAEGTLQFVGEDSIEHLAKDGEAKLFLGNAFDLSAEKEETDYQEAGKYCYKQSYKIALKNSKEEDVEITVVHHIWGDTEVVTSSYPVSKETADKIEFEIPVKAGEEIELTFTTKTCY